MYVTFIYGDSSWQALSERNFAEPSYLLLKTSDNDLC
jgi:hypothetical protein